MIEGFLPIALQVFTHLCHEVGMQHAFSERPLGRVDRTHRVVFEKSGSILPLIVGGTSLDYVHSCYPLRSAQLLMMEQGTLLVWIAFDLN
jgi:hypothetical protein